MRGFIFCVLLIAAVVAKDDELCDDSDCNVPCLPGGRKVCVFDEKEGCFTEYASCCAWKETKCKLNLKRTVFNDIYCTLKNFSCLV